VAAAGCRIRHITDPGTVDGGDVLKVGATIYVGLGERTNATAADQLAPGRHEPSSPRSADLAGSNSCSSASGRWHC
jgi:hypothetical protein